MRDRRTLHKSALAAAITVVLLAEGGTGRAAPAPDEAGATTGATLFAGACAGCHAAGSPRVLSGQKLLAQTHAITGDDPTEAITLILHGRQPPPEARGPWMPGYAAILTDAQVAELLAWLRRDAGRPAWPDLDKHVRATSQEARR